jgi:hypothetical protein
MDNPDTERSPIRIFPVPTFNDIRGRLRVCELGQVLPFIPVRTFIISDVPMSATRAGHAVSCDLFMLVACGSCKLTSSVNGTHEDYQFTSHLGGVYVQADTWILLSDFAPGTALLVYAQKLYAETQYRNQS